MVADGGAGREARDCDRTSCLLESVRISGPTAAVFGGTGVSANICGRGRGETKLSSFVIAMHGFMGVGGGGGLKSTQT